MFQTFRTPFFPSFLLYCGWMLSSFPTFSFFLSFPFASAQLLPNCSAGRERGAEMGAWSFCDPPPCFLLSVLIFSWKSSFWRKIFLFFFLLFWKPIKCSKTSYFVWFFKEGQYESGGSGINTFNFKVWFKFWHFLLDHTILIHWHPSGQQHLSWLL